MEEKLRIELTREERGGDYDSDTVAIIFRRREGEISISEEWTCSDETYGPGVTVTIPARIWRLGLEWLATPPSQT